MLKKWLVRFTTKNDKNNVIIEEAELYTPADTPRPKMKGLVSFCLIEYIIGNNVK